MPVPTITTAVIGGVLGLTVAWRPAIGVASTWTSRVAAGETAGCAEHVHDRLFFGLRTGDGVVSAEQWSRFLEEVVTPRFPDGFTVVDASGQWRAAGDAHITVEPSRVVEIAHDDSADARRHVHEVVEA
ncbi:MAG: DUF3574 domain-containing protein [Vicinamibacterales bacterium]